MISVFDKIKHKNIYLKFNVIMLDKVGTNYRIKISEIYSEFDFNKGDIYNVDYMILNQFSLKVLKNLLKLDKINI